MENGVFCRHMLSLALCTLAGLCVLCIMENSVNAFALCLLCMLMSFAFPKDVQSPLQKLVFELEPGRLFIALVGLGDGIYKDGICSRLLHGSWCARCEKHNLRHFLF